jgi:Tetracyclin repressor-like, C-terminal domain
MLRELAGTYPHITELVMAITHDEESVVGQGCDDQFEFALDLMLDGLERLQDTACSAGTGEREAGLLHSC